MNADRSTHDTLVGRLLAEYEKYYTTSPAGLHVDEDTLALFAEGRLREPELDGVIRHLADCGQCRARAGLLLIAAGDDSDLAELPGVIRWYRRPALQVLALAAGLLLCVTGFFVIREGRQQWAENSAYQSAETLLADGRFDEAKAAVDAARGRRVTSSRLDNIAAQALRRMSSTVALASAGKLTELGIGIGGIVAREPSAGTSAADAQRAKELLDLAARDNVEAALNRGHLLLQLNEPAQAREQFESLIGEHADHTLVWLGLGNAQYLLGQYSAAAQSYQRSVTLEPAHLAARINLAMAYDELGDVPKSLAAWNDLLSDPAVELSDEERGQIEAQIRALQKSQ